MIKNKKNLFIISTLVIIISIFLIWINSASKSPEAAIKKYIRLKSITSSLKDIKTDKTNIKDPNYGTQFYVTGVKGEYETIHFFYLKENESGWSVITAGSGP